MKTTVDGFYWAQTGTIEPLILERCTSPDGTVFWYMGGVEEVLSNDEVDVISGPIELPSEAAIADAIKRRTEKRGKN